MGIIIFWLIMAAIVAMIASSKGYSGGGWFVYGLLIWPIALVHILVTTTTGKATEQKAIASGGKRCPRCAEVVREQAEVCRFCQHEFAYEAGPISPFSGMLSTKKIIK